MICLNIICLKLLVLVGLTWNSDPKALVFELALFSNMAMAATSAVRAVRLNDDMVGFRG